MTEYTAPVENLIKVIDDFKFMSPQTKKFTCGFRIRLTCLVGTSRHKACAPIRSECTHPSKLITPVHMIVLINNNLKKTDYQVALQYFHLSFLFFFLQADIPYKTV